MRYSFYSKIDFDLWLFSTVRSGSRTSLLVPTSLIIHCVASDVSYPRLALPPPRTSLLVPVDTSSQIDCCCCECQLLFSVTFGAGRAVVSLSNSIRCRRVRTHKRAAVVVQTTKVNIKCATPKTHHILSASVRGRFLSHRHVPPTACPRPRHCAWKRGVKKMVGRPSLLCFPPTMSPFSRMELMLKEQPL